MRTRKIHAHARDSRVLRISRDACIFRPLSYSPPKLQTICNLFDHCFCIIRTRWPLSHALSPRSVWHWRPEKKALPKARRHYTQDLQHQVIQIMDYSAVIHINPAHESNQLNAYTCYVIHQGKCGLFFFLFTGCQKKIGPDLFKSASLKCRENGIRDFNTYFSRRKCILRLFFARYIFLKYSTSTRKQF